MPRTYQHLFFDLDNTLWDFGTNCALTLTMLHEKHQLDPQRIPLDAFIKKYREVNDTLWHGFHKGTVTKEEIRSQRFTLTFHHFKEHTIPAGIDEEFLQICPAQGHVYPGTHEVLDYLQNKGYVLHIITNGFKETQHIKISTSGLQKYFAEVIETEDCGFKKPDLRIFEYAFKKSGASPSESLMIGDDYEADIVGGMNAGMDQVFLNHHRISAPAAPSYEIFSIKELLHFL
ncbi:MAG: YjjG family noncanonical pyrimidine nucleotidase [Cytophagaceae bacterium]|jgi:putative hydrolase of the HAD superfamily|nr:YjjG family noncanonical pyrimidine nucleotidase [Cytophagaceae bacterium]